MTDKERIKQYLDTQGISKNKFYTTTGLSNSFLESGKSFGLDKARIILDNYKDINPTWLLTGKGEMLLKEGVAPADGEHASSEPTGAHEAQSTAIVRLEERIKELEQELHETNKKLLDSYAEQIKMKDEQIEILKHAEERVHKIARAKGLDPEEIKKGV